jgi:predicted nucleic-acid-binding Zn-ribbon protein
MLAPGVDADKYHASRCHKVPYAEPSQAQSTLTHLRAKQKKRGRRNNNKAVSGTYRCDRCGYWHLTSHPY